MKTKLLVVLVMLYSAFTCFAYERVYAPGESVFKEELDERGYRVTKMYIVQPDGTLKLEEYHNPGFSYYLRDQEAKEVVSITKEGSNNFNVKYKDGHKEQYRLTKDGRLCKGLLSCP